MAKRPTQRDKLLHRRTLLQAGAALAAGAPALLRGAAAGAQLAAICALMSATLTSGLRAG